MSVIDRRIVKASFKENPAEERKLFPKSTCLMPISVGQAVHEGAKFEAVIKLINASFKHCTILVDDSVQRHTIGIMNDASSEELYQLAVEEGNAWLMRCDQAIHQLTIPYEILRWDDWYTNINYTNSHQRVLNEYHHNEHYKNAIHANIEDFLSRYLKNFSGLPVDYDRAFLLCLDYLIEECAVMCLWTEKEYDFEVYPSGRNKAMAATYQFLIKPLFPQFLKPVALRFKKYPGLSQPVNSESHCNLIVNNSSKSIVMDR